MPPWDGEWKERRTYVLVWVCNMPQVLCDRFEDQDVLKKAGTGPERARWTHMYCTVHAMEHASVRGHGKRVGLGMFLRESA